MQKAIKVDKVGGSDVMKLVKVKLFPPPKDNEVLVEMKCSGVNPVDAYIRAGNFPNPELPYIPHMDGAGIVKEVGAKVSKVKAGDRVFVSENGRFGTLAEYAIIKERNVFLLPEKMGFAGGAALGIPYFTAYRALYILGKGKPGKKVLVHGGTGGVGQAAVQLAVGGNMEVTGTAGTKAGIDTVLANGASAAYIHREKGYVEKMKEEQGGFDIIVEMVANVNLANDLNLLRKNGIIVVVGSKGEATINPMATVMPESAIVGCLIFNSTDAEWEECGEAIHLGIKNGIVRPRIHKRYPMSQASKAHDDIMSGEPTNGKLVVDIAK